MASWRTLRFIAVAFALVAVLSLTTTPVAGAANADPAAFEFHAADLLKDGADEITGGTSTLVLEGSATEGDIIRIELDEGERDAFDITGVSATAGEIGVSTDHTADAIEIELTNLGGDGNVSGTEIDVAIDLRATDAVASGAGTYNATTIATVDAAGLDVGLDGESAITVSIVEAAEIGFTAEEIDQTANYGFFPIVKYETFVLSFNKSDVKVDDGDSINVSVDPDTIEGSDRDGFLIGDVWEETTSYENISSIDISTSNQANVLDNSIDQITITINTADSGPTRITDETIAINIEVLIDKESLKYAANRYHNADFLEIDVEGENNSELTDNADIQTESPLFVDIYPSEIEQFELGRPASGTEIPINETQIVEIDTARDRFGNEIRQPTIEATLSGAGETRTYEGIEIDTDERDGLALGREGEIEPRLGVFDLTVEVTDIEGPETHGNGAVTATIDNLTIYPDDVRVDPVAPSNDFDVDDGGVELAVDLGVPNDEIGRVDIELRRERGLGTVTVNHSSGTPTETALWENTEYAGDGEMRPENTWVIERGLTAADFDENGTRRYVLEADTADRYEIAADVMPYEGRLVANETDVETSTAEAHDGASRGSAEIVATGAIEAVTDVSIRDEHEFVGVDVDAGGAVVVELGAFLDANGNRVSNTDETVTVGLGNETIESGIGAGSVSADVGPTANDPAATVALDPTAIDATEIETGANATVAIEFENGRQLNATELTLVHRAIEPGGTGWYAGSIPQPATLYVDADGACDLTQWDPTAERYEGLAGAASDGVFDRRHLEAEHLHRGFYFRSNDSSARIGFDFVTDEETAANRTETDGTIALEAGWHFGSSNYDLSAHPRRELGDDVNWTDYGFGEDDDAFVVRDDDFDRIHDQTDGSDIDGATAIVEHDEAYWIRVRDDEEIPLVRNIVFSTFTEGDGVQR